MESLGRTHKHSLILYNHLIAYNSDVYYKILVRKNNHTSTKLITQPHGPSIYSFIHARKGYVRKSCSNAKRHLEQ